MSKRELRVATDSEDALGPLSPLPGVWANIRPEHRILRDDDGSVNLFEGEGSLTGSGLSPFDGRGWNMIALPFAIDGERRNYRLLMNQYNEVLTFRHIDDKVPNRGITVDPIPPADPLSAAKNTDQRIAAIDYEQMIAQISAKDITEAKDQNGELLAGRPGLPIHHEPGFFLHLRDNNEELNIARLGTIPHGNALTALGKSRVIDGPPDLVVPNGLPSHGFPEGFVRKDVDIVSAVKAATDPGSYLFPYNHFSANPFKGVLGDTPGFPGFSPEFPAELLKFIPGNVIRTTILEQDTTLFDAGIVNIPFVERQADAAEMKATFWIMELDEKDANGKPRFVMAYFQFIFLDFFQRNDEIPGRIRWPHISINMMEKVEWPKEKISTESRVIMKST